MDELWSFVDNRVNKQWGLAMDVKHARGLAVILGTVLKVILQLFGISGVADLGYEDDACLGVI